MRCIEHAHTTFRFHFILCLQFEFHSEENLEFAFNLQVHTRRYSAAYRFPWIFTPNQTKAKYSNFSPNTSIACMAPTTKRTNDCAYCSLTLLVLRHSLTSTKESDILHIQQTKKK